MSQPPPKRDPSMGGSKLAWDPVSHYLAPDVAASYDSERFNSVAGRVFQWLERRAVLAAFRAIPTTATVLDLPCGTGRLAEHLLGAGYRVVGADISPAMLDQAQRRLNRFHDRFTIEVCDARVIGTQGVRFEAALCARVLMHFPLDEQDRKSVV